jgi:TonB family protein
MKSSLIQLLILVITLHCMEILANNSRSKPVYIDNINIKTVAVGLFTKNTIEIIFHNPNDTDSMEAICFFRTNRNSFIKELWLEIDGHNKRAETFERQTGERIYEEVTGRRLDPALLRTNGYGYYTLRVFPFEANESRRAIIELYSILEENNNSFTWLFSTNQTTEINIDYQSMHPSGTQFSKTVDGNPKAEPRKELDPINKLNLKYSNSIQLSFFFPEKGETYLIYNDRFRFSWQLNPQIDKPRVIIDYDQPHVILEKIVALTKEQKPVYLDFGYYGLSGFAIDFIEYLKRVHDLDVLYEKQYSESHWEERDGYWIYKNSCVFLDGNPIIAKNYSKEFSCTFLDYFLEYNELLRKDVSVHVEREYLTPSTAKIVLEENERVNKIRDEEVQKWEESRIPLKSEDISEDLTIEEDEVNFSKIVDELPQEEKPIVPFFALSEKPEVIKQGKPEYPELARKAGIEGRVTVEVVIGTTGDVEQVKVVKGHPILNDAAIEAAKKWKFKPGKQKDKLVKVRMTIPIDFKLMDSQKYPDYRDYASLADSSKWFDYYDKRFIFAIIDRAKVLIEEGFSLEKADQISYKSDDHFELLFERPDLIKYSIYYPRMLISTDEKKEKWIFIK